MARISTIFSRKSYSKLHILKSVDRSTLDAQVKVSGAQNTNPTPVWEFSFHPGIWLYFVISCYTYKGIDRYLAMTKSNCLCNRSIAFLWRWCYPALRFILNKGVYLHWPCRTVLKVRNFVHRFKRCTFPVSVTIICSLTAIIFAAFELVPLSEWNWQRK